MQDTQKETNNNEVQTQHSQEWKGNYDVTSPIFAQGLFALLQPVVTECDTRIQAVLASQRQLAQQIDALSAELDRFTEVTKTPLLAEYINKLLKAKDRMVVINNILYNIQQRLDFLQKDNTLPPPRLPHITVPVGSSSTTHSQTHQPMSPSRPPPAQSPASTTSSTTTTTTSTTTSTTPTTATTPPPQRKTSLIDSIQPEKFLSSWLGKAKSLAMDSTPKPAPTKTESKPTPISTPSATTIQNVEDKSQQEVNNDAKVDVEKSEEKKETVEDKKEQQEDKKEQKEQKEQKVEDKKEIEEAQKEEAKEKSTEHPQDVNEKKVEEDNKLQTEVQEEKEN